MMLRSKGLSMGVNNARIGRGMSGRVIEKGAPTNARRRTRSGLPRAKAKAKNPPAEFAAIDIETGK